MGIKLYKAKVGRLWCVLGWLNQMAGSIGWLLRYPEARVLGKSMTPRARVFILNETGGEL